MPLEDDDPFVVDANTDEDPFTVDANTYGLPVPNSKKSIWDNFKSGMMQGRMQANAPPILPSIINALKGVPVLGNFVPDTEDTDKLNEQFPNQAGLGRFLGSTAAVAPIAGQFSKIPQVINRAPRAPFTRTLDKFWPSVATEGSIFSGINMADKVAEKGVQGELPSSGELLASGATGFAAGVSPILARRMITPLPLPPVKGPQNVSPVTGMKTAGFQQLPNTATAAAKGMRAQMRAEDVLSPILRSGVGAVAGAMLPVGPIGPILGAIGGAGINKSFPGVPTAARKFGDWVGNQATVRNPQIQAILDKFILGALMSDDRGGEQPGESTFINAP